MATGHFVTTADQEVLMANKDRGSKSSKKPAAKTLKQKRAEKKAKKSGH